MGEARKRGTFEERKTQAIARQKEKNKLNQKIVNSPINVPSKRIIILNEALSHFINERNKMCFSNRKPKKG